MQVNKRQFRYKVFAGFTRVTLKTFKTFKLPQSAIYTNNSFMVTQAEV